LQAWATYLDEVMRLVRAVRDEEAQALEAAADLTSAAIGQGRFVNLFGSGHSALPALDAFPRYGSFVGWRPILDPRLLWQVPTGPGGTRELLWLEQQPGYIRHFLEDFSFQPGEVFVVYSHGGVHAAPVEVALYARQRGLAVVAVTSRANAAQPPQHPSGKKLADLADVVIDTHVPPADALVRLAGAPHPVAAGSTVAAVAITMALMAETAQRLAYRSALPPAFVSPHLEGVDAPTHNAQVYATYRRWRCRMGGD
jgi:uncharacterized phosphosugar-binding protein